MTRGKRRVTHRGVATRVLGVLSGRPGLITTAESIAAQLGKDVTVGEVSSAVSYLRIHKHAPIERVAAGAYKWTEPKMSGPEVTAPDGSVMTSTGWVAPALEIPAVSIRRGGVVAGIETHDDPVVVCDFVVVKRAKDLIVLEDTDDGSLWVARKL